MATKPRKSKTSSSKKKQGFKVSKKNKIIFGCFLIVLSLALFFSFISFYFTWQEDQSLLAEFLNRDAESENLLNKFGATISHFFMYKGFGLASFAFPALLAITGLYLFLGLNGKNLWSKWIWGLLGVIWISIALGFFFFEQPLLGGQIGYEMNDFLQDYIGKIGVFLLLLFTLVGLMVRLFNFSPEAIGNYFREINFSKPKVASATLEEESIELNRDDIDYSSTPKDLAAYWRKHFKYQILRRVDRKLKRQENE